MGTLSLACNYITGTGPLASGSGGFGHLQLVYDDGVSLEEIEVTSPWTGIAGGSWVFLENQDHIENTSYYGQPDNYAIVALDIGG